MVWTAPSAPCRRQRGAQAPIVYVQCALRGLAVRSRGIARRWPQGHLVLSCKHLGASPVPALALTLSLSYLCLNAAPPLVTSKAPGPTSAHSAPTNVTPDCHEPPLPPHDVTPPLDMRDPDEATTHMSLRSKE